MTEAAVPPKKHDNRLAHIDCLRALAAIMVVIHHFADSSFKLAGASGGFVDATKLALYEYIDLGRTGVLLFFIISGYCIANSILRPSPRPIATFAVNRIARLYPAYWLSLLGVIALFGVPGLGDLVTRIFLAQYFLGRPDGLGVYWTLAIELIFYAVCVALFFVGVIGNLARLKIVWWVLICYCLFAAVMRAAAGIPLPYAVTWFLALMIGGAILRRIDDSQSPAPRTVMVAGAIILIAALVISMCIYRDASVYDKSWQRDFIANAVAVCLFFGSNYGYRFQAAMIAYLGKVSYSIYLFHLLIFELAVIWLSEVVSDTGSLGAVCLIVAAFCMTVFVAAFVYSFVEMPAIRLGRRVADTLARPTQGAADLYRSKP